MGLAESMMPISSIRERCDAFRLAPVVAASREPPVQGTGNRAEA